MRGLTPLERAYLLAPPQDPEDLRPLAAMVDRGLLMAWRSHAGVLAPVHSAATDIGRLALRCCPLEGA